MTTTKTQTLQSILDSADPNLLADALRRTAPGKQNAIVKVVVVGITAAAAFDITTAAFAALAAVTITGIDNPADAGEGLPAIGEVVSLRCTASGTANSVGTYAITDSGTLTPTAGANVGLATLSDDGKTITFPSTVTAFVLRYRPRSPVAVTAEFPDFI